MSTDSGEAKGPCRDCDSYASLYEYDEMDGTKVLVCLHCYVARRQDVIEKVRGGSLEEAVFHAMSLLHQLGSKPAASSTSQRSSRLLEGPLSLGFWTPERVSAYVGLCLSTEETDAL